MAKYKIHITIDDHNKFWIVIDNGKFIRNPTEDDLKGAKSIAYNSTNICPRCREDNNITDKSILYPNNACHGINKDGDDIDEWVCCNHRRKDYERYDPNSRATIQRQLRDRRTGNLKEPRQILADNCEELTEKWLGAKRLSVKYDKYSMLPLDHDPITKHISVTIGDKLVDLYGKLPQTKGRRYNSKFGQWSHKWEIERYKKFDILIFYCVSEDGKVIERIYIFPKKKVVETNGTSIVREATNSRGVPIISRHERYRVKDKDILKKVNDLWNKIIDKKIDYGVNNQRER